REPLHGAIGVIEHGKAAVADRGVYAGRRIERRDPCPARAQALGQRALRRELDLELAGEVLALELLVLADVRRHHLLYLLVAEQDTEAEVVDAAVVGDDHQALLSELAERGDAALRDTAEAEAAGEDRRAVRDVTDGVEGALIHLVHVKAELLQT